MFHITSPYGWKLVKDIEPKLNLPAAMEENSMVQGHIAFGGMQSIYC